MITAVGKQNKRILSRRVLSRSLSFVQCFSGADFQVRSAKLDMIEPRSSVFLDRIGRKPVLVVGLVGNALATIVFGFSSRSFTGALVARCIAGSFAGTVPVVHSVVGELADKYGADSSRPYSMMGLAWNSAASIGPVIGYGLR